MKIKIPKKNPCFFIATQKIGMRNMHVATAVYNYRFYFELLGVKHLEIPTCCSREEWLGFSWHTVKSHF